MGRGRLASEPGLMWNFEYLSQYPNYLMFNGVLFFLGMCFESPSVGSRRSISAWLDSGDVAQARSTDLTATLIDHPHPHVARMEISISEHPANSLRDCLVGRAREWLRGSARVNRPFRKPLQ